MLKTTEDLKQTRLAAFKLARERIILAWKEEKALLGTDDGSENKDAPQMSEQEQLELISWYQIKIRDYAKFFKFDKHVEASAIILFKRFYLSNSILEYDPKNILMTCLFLATKIEHQIIPLEEFLRKIPKSPTSLELIELELLVSSALHFEYVIHHPYWPLHGFFLDLQVYILQEIEPGMRSTALKSLQSSYLSSVALVPRALLSDLPLLFSPSQIALGCLWASNPLEFSLKDYISWRFKIEEQSTMQINALIVVIQQISHEILGHHPIEKELAKILASKADSSFSPEFNPKCKLYEKIEAKKRADDWGGSGNEETTQNPF